MAKCESVERAVGGEERTGRMIPQDMQHAGRDAADRENWQNDGPAG